MIIYNVTTHVSHSVKELWIEWMKKKHIPEIMNKGCFTKYQLVELLEVDETEGKTYAVQFYAESRLLYDNYVELHAPGLREDSLKAWGQNVISFRSVMKVID
jgi:hypothetical protein